MYLYRIGHWDESQKSHVLLVHKQLMSRDRFEAIIYSAIEAAIEKRLREKKKVHCFNDIFIEVLDYLTLKKHFVALETGHNWGCYGKGSLFVEDYNVHADEVLKQLRKDLQKEGYGIDTDSEYSKYFKKKKKKRKKKTTRRKKNDKKD